MRRNLLRKLKATIRGNDLFFSSSTIRPKPAEVAFSLCWARLGFNEGNLSGSLDFSFLGEAFRLWDLIFWTTSLFNIQVLNSKYKDDTVYRNVASFSQQIRHSCFVRTNIHLIPNAEIWYSCCVIFNFNLIANRAPRTFKFRHSPWKSESWCFTKHIFQKQEILQDVFLPFFQK